MIKESQILSLPITVTVSIFTVSVFVFLTLTAIIPILFNAILQHIIISPIHCTEHTVLLKALHNHVWWDALPCCSPHWLNNTFIFLGLYTYLNAWKRFTVFSTDCVSGVMNFKYMFLNLVLCLWSDQSELMAPFMVFRCNGKIVKCKY